jgi:hypothetical protein
MMIATSAEVPPMSRLMTLSRPAWRAAKPAPITPAAVPDSSICRQACLPSSAVITPPFDFVTIASAATPAFFSACCSEAR